VQRLGGLLIQIWALLISILVLVLGNGLQGTLLGVRASLEGMSQQSVGFMMSAYYLGYLGGSLLSPRWIIRVGHIRTFAALASVASAVSLAHALFVNEISWSILRVIYGACYAGLVLVIESWLNGNTDRTYRGRVLSIYGILVLTAWSGSQFLLNAAPPGGFELFCLVSILLSFALAPVTLARISAPPVSEARAMTMKTLYSISPIGFAGIFAIGFGISSVTTMGPVFAQNIGLKASNISGFMGILLAGALFLQWPLGWLSDMLDRRWVIVGTSLVGVVLAFLLAGGDFFPLTILFFLAFLFGGMLLPVYSLCIAHVNDLIDEENIISAASTLLVVFGIGSVIGPLSCGILMNTFGPGALFYAVGVIMLGFGVFSLLRMPAWPSVEEEEKDPHIYIPRTSPVVIEMDNQRAPAEDQA